MTRPTASSGFAGKSSNAAGIGLSAAGAGLGLCPWAEAAAAGVGSGRSSGVGTAAQFHGEEHHSVKVVDFFSPQELISINVFSFVCLFTKGAFQAEEQEVLPVLCKFLFILVLAPHQYMFLLPKAITFLRGKNT